MKTVIMAGGKGTRISSVASDIPKPMIKIEGKPVLEHEIECLRDQGFTDMIITVSHLGSIIMDYFGDGSRFGVQIQYFNEETEQVFLGHLSKENNFPAIPGLSGTSHITILTCEVSAAVPATGL